MDTLSKQILSGLLWRYLEKFGNQIVQFAVSIILARILSPSDFGTIALNTIFLVIATLLTDSGFVSAVIQKKEIDQKDLSTVFYANIAIAIFLYAILYIFAPYIAKFYETPILTRLLRWQALILIFSALNGVQQALLSRQMLFKKSFKITFTATSMNGIVGISMALLDYNLWSLIGGQLVAAATTTIMFWIIIGWRPTYEFSLSRLKQMLGFSSRFMSVGLLTAIYNNILSVFIGKQYPKAQLGYYQRGQTLATLVVDNLVNSLGQVLLPALSKCQSDKQVIIQKTRQAIVYSSFVVFFLMIMLIVLAKPIILFLYGPQWESSIPFLQLTCIGYLFYAINQVNQITICSIGRSDLHLKYDLIKKVVMTICIIIGSFGGIYWMICGYSIAMIISACISTIPVGREIGYDLFQQLHDISSVFIAALISGFCAYLFSSISTSTIICLIVQSVIGCIIYLSLSILLKIDGVRPIIVHIIQKLHIKLKSN